MYVMAWDTQRRRGGTPVVTPTRIGSEIANFYRHAVPLQEADGYPFLTQLHIHNECEISAIHGLEFADDPEGDEPSAQFGWLVHDGRFARISEDGTPYRDRDRTIASLLASLHAKVAWEDFNRFFSYTDEVHGRDVLSYRHHGTKWAYEGLSPAQARALTAKIPKRPANRA
jgi:hypothetical protein